MFCKRWVGATVIGASIFVLSPAQAMTKANVHAKNLGRVAPSTLASRLQLHADNALVAAQTVHLDNGRKLIRVRQVYKGVPVYGRSVVVERGSRGQVLSVDGTLERHLDRELASVHARLTPVQARMALQRARGQSRQRVRSAETKLYVYSRDQQSARLIYHVSYLVGAGNHVSRPTAIIDANTGKVIKQWDGLTTGRRPRGGATPVPVRAKGPGGNGFTGLYFYNGSGPGREKFRVTRRGHVCYMRNRDVATYNLAGGQRVTLWSFGCYSNNPANWISSGDTVNGAFSAINDAHHFGQVVHDMYSSWFGQPPLKNADGSPMQLHMWVHYGTNYGNAFWDGSEMVFGDGGSLFYPFVSLDITGHEISHGFTEQHSGLEYTGQSGGMNEAFSDMAGQAVVYYDTGSNDFLVGEDILKPGTSDLLGLNALRDMCDPARDGVSIDNAADYFDGINVHYSSGVYNKAFCVLAKTAGWNTRMAFEVFHDANALYWGPTETFDSGACGVEQAATDRSYSVAEVTAAFTAVGVTCAAPPAPPVATSPTPPPGSAHFPLARRAASIGVR